MEDACNKFQSYFYSSGVAEALRSTLVLLREMKKKPKNSVEFIRQNLPPAQTESIASLKYELAQLKKDLVWLMKAAAKIKPQTEKKKKGKNEDRNSVKAETVATESGLGEDTISMTIENSTNSTNQSAMKDK